MRYFSPAIPRSSPAAVCTSAGSEALAALTGHTPDIGQGTPETGQISGGEACGLQGTAGGDGGDGGEAVFAAPGAVGTASAGVGAPLCSAATATAASSLKLPNVALFVKPSMLVWITVIIAVLGSEPIARATDTVTALRTQNFGRERCTTIYLIVVPHARGARASRACYVNVCMFCNMSNVVGTCDSNNVRDCYQTCACVKDILPFAAAPHGLEYL